MHKWVQTWEQAGKALSSIKTQELRDKDYYTKNLWLLNDMLQYAAEHRTEQKSSGLVTMQKYFRKYYNRMKNNAD
mgnify:FL=1